MPAQSPPQPAQGPTYAPVGSVKLVGLSPAQNQVSYAFDDANRLTDITQGTSSVTFAYDNANRRTTVTLPNGIVVGYTYDNASRVTGVTWTLSGTQIGDLEHAYDADGRVTKKTGSMAAVNLPSAVMGNTFNADNEMVAFNGQAMTYDANGNLLSDGANTYGWDARNHLVGISGGSAASFVYDPFGRRAQKTVGGLSTQFLYDNSNPVQELQSGTPSANLMTGLGIDEFFTRTDSSGPMSFLTDMLGSTLALTDTSGTVATSYSYDPFGNVTAAGAASSNPYQFTGRENDNTGLHYYRARYYSPTSQRFIGQDPGEFNSGDYNLYEYVGNDPVSEIDPEGMARSGLPWRLDDCTMDEYRECEEMCTPRGVKSCKVMISSKLKRFKPPLKLYKADRRLSCECNDPPPECPGPDQDN
jgi:RHS repeat-associated protein